MQPAALRLPYSPACLCPQGLAKLEGWLQLVPGWEQRYTVEESRDAELPVLPDEDLAIMAMLKEERAKVGPAAPSVRATGYMGVGGGRGWACCTNWRSSSSSSSSMAASSSSSRRPEGSSSS
jgi:hypothetical protein